ncbi:hypothetical protein GIJ05_16830, partial [Laceyella tengchongensis]|nr:hypothetical protein [Laceyella tengchongensis]
MSKVTIKSIVQQFDLEVISGWDQLDRRRSRSRTCTDRAWNWPAFSR